MPSRCALPLVQGPDFPGREEGPLWGRRRLTRQVPYRREQRSGPSPAGGSGGSVAEGPLLDARRHARGMCSDVRAVLAVSSGGDGRASTPAGPRSPHRVWTRPLRLRLAGLA